MPIVDVPSVTGGVEVGQEGSDDGEVCGEIVIHVLGLPGEILGGDDPVGPHLQGERRRVLRNRRGASAAGRPPRPPLSPVERGTGLRALRPRGLIQPRRKQRPRASPFPPPRELQIRGHPSCSHRWRGGNSCKGESLLVPPQLEIPGRRQREGGEKNGWRKGTDGEKTRAALRQRRGWRGRGGEKE